MISCEGCYGNDTNFSVLVESKIERKNDVVRTCHHPDSNIIRKIYRNWRLCSHKNHSEAYIWVKLFTISFSLIYMAII